MSLEKTIQADIMTAMKAKDETKLLSLRAVKTAIINYKSSSSFAGDKNEDLDDNTVIKMMQKMVKERRDTAQIYKDAGRFELADKELAEADVIEAYLPQPLSENEVIELVKTAMLDVNATSIKDMGKVIAQVNKVAAGRADGKTISNIVKRLLS
jgi:uncharacterized protein YqeY